MSIVLIISFLFLFWKKYAYSPIFSSVTVLKKSTNTFSKLLISTNVVNIHNISHFNSNFRINCLTKRIELKQISMPSLKLFYLVAFKIVTFRALGFHHEGCFRSPGLSPFPVCQHCWWVSSQGLQENDSTGKTVR